MTGQTELLKEIEKLPSKYYSEVSDFVGYLKKKAQAEYDNDIDGYEAMAADIEREQEAREWCNAYFGPVCDK